MHFVPTIYINLISETYCFCKLFSLFKLRSNEAFGTLAEKLFKYLQFEIINEADLAKPIDRHQPSAAVIELLRAQKLT